MVARLTILIVEDDDELRRVFRHALAMAGFDVHEARGGFEALRRLDSSPPDAVVLDLMLPGMDGFTVRHELAAHARTRNIPIIVVTGSNQDLKDLEVKCVLRKPIGPDQVVDAVQRSLGSNAGTCGS
jgi:CheY-like chemotaxis protein